MHPAIKNQKDIGIDEPTIDASDSDDNKDMARQEGKDDADINYMLSRFGVIPPRGAPTYGEWDDTIDLQTALQAVHDARTAYADLPEALRKKFNSMEELLTAYHNGSLVIKEEDEPEPTPAPAPEPPKENA